MVICTFFVSGGFYCFLGLSRWAQATLELLSRSKRTHFDHYGIRIFFSAAVYVDWIKSIWLSSVFSNWGFVFPETWKKPAHSGDLSLVMARSSFTRIQVRWVCSCREVVLKWKSADADGEKLAAGVLTVIDKPLQVKCLSGPWCA